MNKIENINFPIRNDKYLSVKNNEILLDFLDIFQHNGNHINISKMGMMYYNVENHKIQINLHGNLVNCYYEYVIYDLSNQI